MEQIVSWPSMIKRLRSAGNADTQFAILMLCSSSSLDSVSGIKLYHDALLAVCAYPYHPNVHKLATLELQRIAALLKDQQHNLRWQESLIGTGLPFTETRCQFSADLLEWLLQEFSDRINVFEAAATGEVFQQFCQAVLPGIEFFHATQGNLNTWNRIKCLSGHYHNAAALQWLLKLFHQKQWEPVLKDQLYDALKIFISWKLTGDLFNRSFLRCPVTDIHYRKPFAKKTSSISVINKPVENPLPVSETEKNDLIAIARASLALYYRETDPVSFADPGETSLFDMGNGLRILLTGMKKERRLSLETYIGYMAFQNGVPVAYGGGWMFGYRCKMGINIYPPFRGIESDKLFCQVLRLYYQYFQLGCFVVKPYQFGKGNPDGLKSGAFWFYYKLGFRPADPAIKKMADAEWEKIVANRSYRTPISVLKNFTACNISWEPIKNKTVYFDAERVSITITAMIRNRFNGNREDATRYCMKTLKSFIGLKSIPRQNTVEKNTWQNWSLLFGCLPGTAAWTPAERKRFLALIELKYAVKERDFIIALQQHQSFWLSVKAMLSSSLA